MSEKVAISLKNVSKCYKRYAHPVDRLKEILLPRKSKVEEFWALRDIDLDVLKGETLGVIGQNGSGKSTLLQIIAGTLRPTTGEVQVNGRVSALLELGSGFNPEFTGRQNVFFNGQILGLNKKEIEDKFDNIAAFAEIGNFINQPVKTYSSGMLVRLAFAVAANTEPKILIVDEALAVGDAKFQARCMKRIRQLKEQGVTILFVSHDSSSLKMLCQRAALMNYGRIIETGKPKEVVNHYTALLSSDSTKTDDITQTASTENYAINKEKYSDEKTYSSFKLNQDIKHRHGNKLATIHNVRLTNLDNKDITKIEAGLNFIIEVSLEAEANLSDLVVGISLRNLMGLVIYGTNTKLMNVQLPSLTQGQNLVMSFQLPCYFNKGIYTVTVGLHSEEGKSYDWIDDTEIFEVFNSNKCDGIIDLNATVRVNRLHYISSANIVHS